MNTLRILGRIVINSVERLGRAAMFLYEVMLGSWELVRRFYLVVQQVYAVGVLTLLIILVSGLFVGMVLGLQGYNTLVKFGSANSLGLLVALSLVRELGPVVTALLFAGRAGSALTAEIGLMKATEQLAGMEMMAVNPITRVIAPRFLGGVLALPLLTALFSAIGVMGGHLVGVGLLGVDAGAFWSQMQNGVDFHDDIMNGVIKSVVFGVVVSWIAVFEGYDAVPTSEGVASATNRTVVYSSLAVLGLDFILTALTWERSDMINRKSLELWVGLFVAAGILALAMLAFKVGNLTSADVMNGYKVTGRFDNVGGLKVKAAVTMAGVRIGRVSAIAFDNKKYQALVTMDIDGRYQNIPKDSSASILTSGLLGDQYVGIEPGGDETWLQNGDNFLRTQSALVLEKLVGQVIFNKAGESAPVK